MRLRELRPSDRAPLEALIRGTSAFSEEEVGVALELVDEGHDPASDYLFIVAEDAAGAPTGYACYGPAPLTDGVYDLYWIVVGASLHRAGIGRALLRATEADVRARAGRMILIETAGKAAYAAQRAFYERTGCALIATFPDYYSVGDDKLVYMRRTA